MQKVESSSLFSRLEEDPANRGVFVVLGAQIVNVTDPRIVSPGTRDNRRTHGNA
jgi:hypothetical protein